MREEHVLDIMYRGPGIVSPVGGYVPPLLSKLPPVYGKQTLFVRIHANSSNNYNRILLEMEEESDCDLVEVEL